MLMLQPWQQSTKTPIRVSMRLENQPTNHATSILDLMRPVSYALWPCWKPVRIPTQNMKLPIRRRWASS